MFERRNEPYNLRNFQKFLIEKKTVNYGLETICYRSPQLWSPLPEKIMKLSHSKFLRGK